MTLLHAEQPGVQLISSKTGQALQDQTLAAYVTNHIWAHTGSNKRFRKFLDGSSLFASTTAGSHPKLVEWYCAQTDALLEQPSSYLVEDSETRQWLTKDDEWTAVHKGYTSQMADSQVQLPACIAACGVCCPDIVQLSGPLYMRATQGFECVKQERHFVGTKSQCRHDPNGVMFLYIHTGQETLHR